MEIIDWESGLQGSALDAKAGISMIKLAGDASFSSYLTMIAAGRSVNAHYHKYGDEHYHIISGVGELTLKDLAREKEQTLSVRQQQSFIVQADTWHQLTNTGEQPLLLMFSCPESHLLDDRHFS